MHRNIVFEFFDNNVRFHCGRSTKPMTRMKSTITRMKAATLQDLNATSQIAQHLFLTPINNYFLI